MNNGVKEFHLVAEPVVREMTPGFKAHLWGYNGQSPGPTIEVVEGDRVRIFVTNKLVELTSIHWHGQRIPNGMDGVTGLNQPVPVAGTAITDLHLGTCPGHERKDLMQAWRRTLLLAGCALALGTARHAAAHGDKGHGKPAAVRKEQKEWGIAGDARDVTRTIEVRMLDSMRFEPADISVRLGETIRFVHRNSGKLMHEFVIGTKKENEQHAALMMKFPNMEHDEPYMAHVPPGKTGQIVWTFNRPGEFEFACLIAGHYQAGMFGRITVASA